jgi:GT2 family glycosyltransferase
LNGRGFLYLPAPFVLLSVDSKSSVIALPDLLLTPQRRTRGASPLFVMDGPSLDSIEISVIIPTCDRPRPLLEAIDSVRKQDGVTLEIIVVDDSVAATARDVMASIADPRVRYIRRPEPSLGRPALVRNDGARLANGRYLYFLDDDDLLEPGTLAVMRAALDATPSAGMAFGAIEPFGDDESLLRQESRYFGDARRIARRLRGRLELSARLTFLSTILVNSACMGRRSAFLAVGGYDAAIPICEDTDLWARVAHASGYIFLDRTVVRYRTGAPSLMRSLAPNDERLQVSYRRIHERFRETHGVLSFMAMKLWARAVLQFV